jgi:hypothetical protein
MYRQPYLQFLMPVSRAGHRQPRYENTGIVSVAGCSSSQRESGYIGKMLSVCAGRQRSHRFASSARSQSRVTWYSVEVPD